MRVTKLQIGFRLNIFKTRVQEIMKPKFNTMINVLLLNNQNDSGNRIDCLAVFEIVVCLLYVCNKSISRNYVNAN